MQLSRRGLLGSAAALGTTPVLRARAQAKPVIKLGVLTDLSRHLSRQHRADHGRLRATGDRGVQPVGHGFEVDLRQADHQNKPDVAASIARQWYDEGVLAAIDVPTSSVALAVAQVAKEKDKIMLNASATTTDLTDGQCSPNTIVWSFDTYENAASTGGAMVKAGNKSWFFITADYVFGHILEAQNMALVKKAGGEVKGAVRYPFPDTTDFSSYLTQAMASGATTLGLANAGLDTQNCVKQAHEFGLEQEDEDRAAAAVHHGRACARACRSGGGPGDDRDVLLGPERPHARLHQAGAAEDAEQLSEPGACQRLWHHAALPEGGGGDGARRMR